MMRTLMFAMCLPFTGNSQEKQNSGKKNKKSFNNFYVVNYCKIVVAATQKVRNGKLSA